MAYAKLEHLLCDEAKLGDGLTACAECESPCEYGKRALAEADDRTLAGLMCGADCETCRQPCNLRRVVTARGLKPAQHRPAASRKRTMQAGWIAIAMRPYIEKHGRFNERRNGAC